MKSKIFFFVFSFLLIGVLGFFYYTNVNNYTKIKTLEEHIVKHPELLPKKDLASLTSFGFSNLRADIYWLETIQYIGGNAVSSEYKKYLYEMLDLITELNPYFEKPYLIGQLLLPDYNDRYENLSQEKQKEYSLKGEAIGLKGMKNFCDLGKIEKIKNEDNLEKIWTNNEYKNPCKSFQIPYGQGFLEYFYLKNNLEAANYYKIASAQSDALEGTKIMAAIMKGKGGEREKSMIMFLNLAKNGSEAEDCKIFSNELEKISYNVFRDGQKLNGETVKNIEDLRKKYFKFDEKTEKNLVLENNCSSYINKAIRELNLYYLEEANKKYFQDKKENAKNGKVLLENGYIDFLPTDFQQYETYGIVYEFDKESGNFDYKMGNY